MSKKKNDPIKDEQPVIETVKEIMKDNIIVPEEKPVRVFSSWGKKPKK